jgi:two-component system cell cycle sensor histidine kinase/response regulator CckA
MTSGPCRVLLLEDDPHDVELIVHNLRRAGVEPVTTVARSRTDLQQHARDEFDVIIADYRLPDLEATAAITELRRHQPDTPFLVVSGSVSEEQLLAMLRLGADDYLLKDRLGRLGAAVHTARERQRLRRERENAAAQVRQRDHEIRHLQRLQSIGVLTGGIAHDFNNLMTVVLGNCDLLLMALPSHPDARALVSAMSEATKRASSLSKQVL